MAHGERPTGSTATTPRRGSRWRLALALVLVIALVGAGCSDDDDDQGSVGAGSASEEEAGDAGPTKGVTDDEISISVIGPWSGPYAPQSELFYTQGFVTWQNELNESGGINGRKIKATRVDHKDTADGAIAACREVASADTFLAVVWGGVGDATGAVTDCLDDRGVINLTIAEPKDGWEHSYTAVTSTPDQGRTLASYVQNEMDAGDEKLGVIFVTDSIYVAVKDAYVDEVRSLDMEVVATEAIEPNQASTTPQLLRLKEAGVEHLAVFATAEAIGILRDLEALEWEPQVSGVAWTFDFITQVSKDLAEGAHALKVAVPTDGPAFEKYKAARERYSPGDASLLSDAMLGYGYALLIGEVLDAAGAAPTAESLLDGLRSIRDYDNGILPPISYGPDDNIGPEASFPVVCCTPDWKWQASGPARRTFKG